MCFCVVPKLEPTYQTHISIKDKIEDTRERFGEKRNLLLLDNNVLASADFNNIIEEIKESGFTKENNYIAPDYYAVAIKIFVMAIISPLISRVCESNMTCC